jgi:hypothetical protein
MPLTPQPPFAPSLAVALIDLSAMMLDGTIRQSKLDRVARRTTNWTLAVVVDLDEALMAPSCY